MAPPKLPDYFLRAAAARPRAELDQAIEELAGRMARPVTRHPFWTWGKLLSIWAPERNARSKALTEAAVCFELLTCGGACTSAARDLFARSLGPRAPDATLGRWTSSAARAGDLSTLDFLCGLAPPGTAAAAIESRLPELELLAPTRAIAARDRAERLRGLERAGFEISALEASCATPGKEPPRRL